MASVAIFMTPEKESKAKSPPKRTLSLRSTALVKKNLPPLRCKNHSKRVGRRPLGQWAGQSWQLRWGAALKILTPQKRGGREIAEEGTITWRPAVLPLGQR